MLVFLVIVGLLIILALAYIAYCLQKQVAEVEGAKAQQQRLFDEQKQQKRESMNKSIQVLAQGIIADQLTKTEGAIRIAALMEFLSVDEAIKEDYSAFFQLAEATAHIPILEKWKALSSLEKAKYDSERHSLEEKYGDFVVDAAKRVCGQYF